MFTKAQISWRGSWYLRYWDKQKVPGTRKRLLFCTIRKWNIWIMGNWMPQIHQNNWKKMKEAINQYHFTSKMSPWPFREGTQAMLWAQSSASTHKTCYTFFLDKVKKQHNRKLCNGKPHKTSDYSKSKCRFMLFLGCLGKHVNRGITVLFFIIRIWIMGYWRYQTL